MKKTAALVVAGAAVAVLAGCAPAVTAGHVTGKQFTPAHDETYYVPICITTGKTVICTPIPEQRWVASEWSLQLTASDKRSGWLDVTEQQYDRARLGQWWGSRTP